MTVNFPEGIEAAGLGTVYLVPAIADLNAPTVAELTATTALNISCHIFGWEPGVDQNNVTSDRYCLKESMETLGKAKRTLQPITIVYDPKDPDSKEYTAYPALMAANASGQTLYAVDRRGYESDVPVAAGQYVDIYPVKVGAVKREPITTTEGELLRSTFQLAVSGPVEIDSLVAA